jgi:hypothetical protein
MKMNAEHEKYSDLIMKLNNNLKKNIDTTDIELTKIEFEKLS